MDLPKAIDTLNHDLLVEKRHAYGFNKEWLKLIFDYLSNRWQEQRLVAVSVLELSYWSSRKVIL